MLDVLPDQPSRRSCTIQRPGRTDFCDRPAISVLDFPICAKHAITTYLELSGLVEANQDNDIVRTLQLLEELDRKPKRRQPPRRKLPTAGPLDGEPVVYYILVDGLVKIGQTKDIGQRLRAYPPSSHLLATEPGDITLERLRHEQFAEHLKHGREWFTPGPSLRAHVESLDTYCTT